MLPGIYYGLTCFPPMWASLPYIEVETEISMCMNGQHHRVEQHAVVSHRMATCRLGGYNTYLVRKRALTNALLLLKLPALHIAAKIEKTLSEFVPTCLSREGQRYKVVLAHLCNMFLFQSTYSCRHPELAHTTIGHRYLATLELYQYYSVCGKLMVRKHLSGYSYFRKLPGSSQKIFPKNSGNRPIRSILCIAFLFLCTTNIVKICHATASTGRLNFERFYPEARQSLEDARPVCILAQDLIISGTTCATRTTQAFEWCTGEDVLQISVKGELCS